MVGNQENKKEKNIKKSQTIKNKKTKSKVKTTISLFVILLACFMTYSAAQEVLTTLQLKKDIADAQATISDLEAQQESYEQDKENLSNPDYVKSYARGKYKVSKNGEQVIILPQGKDESSDETE